MIMPTPTPPKDGCLNVWFAICAVIALVVLGVGLWAVIAVVNHFTA
ncbi:hypothetical protein ACWEJ6_21245 [Nonomuraea sp. NPDC004702]